jgi:hypothetical protein
MSPRSRLAALLSALAPALVLAVLGCAGRNKAGPSYRPASELRTCAEGECVQAELAFRHWANAEYYRGRMVYHCTPGAELDGRPNAEITRVIFAVHGVVGTTEEKLARVTTPPGLRQLRWVKSSLRRAASENPEIDPSTIAVIAPTFQRTEQWQPYTDEDKRIWTWNSSSYSYGTLAAQAENFAGVVKADPVSSFDVIDEFLRAMVIKFPNLEQIVVTGHSAGGQTVHKYVWMGAGVHERMTRAGISVRYMPADGGGYAFPLSRRKMPPGQTRVRPGEGHGDTQTWKWGWPKGCDNWDDWPFGLSELVGDREQRAANYAIEHYLRPVDRKLARKAMNNPDSKHWRKAARKALALQYATREVWHVQASNDNENTFPESCRAQLEGRSRYERFLHFQEAWRLSGIATPDLHFVALDNARHPHSSAVVYGSEAGQHILFE